MASPDAASEPTRRRNWLAVAIGTGIQIFSYFTYAAAFVPPEGEGRGIDPGLVLIAVAVAPFVFIAVGFISRRPETWRRVLLSMGLLLALGLTLGLYSPLVGAAAGFGVGIALCLNMPAFDGQLRRRLLGVAFAVGYMALMRVLIPAAGVLAGAVLPGLMVAFADEYGAWRESKYSNG